MDKQTESICFEELAQMDHKTVTTLWKKHRRELFIRLNKKDGLTYDEIGDKYNVTRQAVGQIINELPTAK